MEKKTSALILILCLALCCGCGTPSNEVPMYGGKPLTLEQQKAHEEFIKSSIETMGSREAACEYTLNIARQYIDKRDLKTAMRRANQAWLLGPNNAEVYYLFGSLTRMQGKREETISLYKKALELNPKHAMVMVNLGREYYNTAYVFYQKGQKNNMRDYLEKALQLYEKASRLAIIKGDLGYIHYQWAVSLLLKEDYSDAWKKIKLSRKYGGKYIEPAFVRELSRYMPEPEESLPDPK
ncbi:MAG: hypothetical protein NG740_03155 [Omnitrophica bacterium]|nr:hypothetical protein [Candidatus Omnitrophota bacterium]